MSTKRPAAWRLIKPRTIARGRPACDDAAASADHARAEPRHMYVVRPSIDGEHRAMMADPAAYGQRPHALRTHVAERHGDQRGGAIGASARVPQSKLLEVAFK